MDSPRELAAMIRTEIEEGKEWQSLSSPVWLTFELADAIATALERADRLERAADKAVYHDACDGWHGDLRAALATGKEGGK